MDTTFIDKVCYMGDDDLDRAAVYLSGIMTHYEIGYDRVDSVDNVPDDFQKKCYALYIVSDYPSARFHDGDMEHIARCVRENGSGLLMIGGWESFFGQKGEYNDTPLAEVLPVSLADSDDRRCSSSGILLTKTMDHPILNGLPWCSPPFVVGYNAVTAKENSTTLLEGARFDLRIFADDEVVEASDDSSCPMAERSFTEQITVQTERGDSLAIRPLNCVPMLVVGEYGKGRTAAFMSDVAPHWVGGLVDWGAKRLCQDLDGSHAIEVGDSYAQLFRNLVSWTGKLS